MEMSTGSGEDMSDVVMIPWFHLTPGDYLLFRSWRPRSTGAIVGACMGLVLLAIFDRWLSATRYLLERRWRHRALVLTMRPVILPGKASPSPSSELSDEKSHQNKEVPPRTIPPFILVHDLPRGLIHTAQALLTYILMLSVMTFNVAFLISIVAGLGLGEMVFGRMGRGKDIH